MYQAEQQSGLMSDVREPPTGSTQHYTQNDEGKHAYSSELVFLCQTKYCSSSSKFSPSMLKYSRRSSRMHHYRLLFVSLMHFAVTMAEEKTNKFNKTSTDSTVLGSRFFFIQKCNLNLTNQSCDNDIDDDIIFISSWSLFF